MADGERAGQGLHQACLGEVVAHIAEAAGIVEPGFGIIGDDAACLLSAVLQRVHAESHEIRGFSDADHAEYAALLLQLVVVEGVAQEWAHGPCLRIRGCGTCPHLETRCAHVTPMSHAKRPMTGICDRPGQLPVVVPVVSVVVGAPQSPTSCW